MILSPLPAHKSILCEISTMLANVLATMLISQKILHQRVVGNMPFIGQSIFETPDLMILMVYHGSLKE